MNATEVIDRHFSDEYRAVTISASALRSLYRTAAASRNRETGGILLGVYSDDLAQAVVLEATPPPADSRSTRYTFVRGTQGLRELLFARWHDEQRTYYLGEWHTHTAGEPRPSDQDRQALHGVARDPLYRCRTPLLLIAAPAVGGTWTLGGWLADGRGERVDIRSLSDGLRLG